MADIRNIEILQSSRWFQNVHLHRNCGKQLSFHACEDLYSAKILKAAKIAHAMIYPKMDKARLKLVKMVLLQVDNVSIAIARALLRFTDLILMATALDNQSTSSQH